MIERAIRNVEFFCVVVAVVVLYVKVCSDEPIKKKKEEWYRVDEVKKACVDKSKGRLARS
jgi:hypothetical protein